MTTAQIVPLQERIEVLPIGWFVNGQRLTRFKVGVYTSRHDMQVLGLKSRYPDNLCELAIGILPQLIRSIEGYTWSELAALLDTNIESLIAEMPASDVLTMICNIRSLEISSALYLQATCPQCGHNCDDRPERGECHDLAGIDIGFGAHLTGDPTTSFTTVKGDRVSLYPIQLMDLGHFCELDFDRELKLAFCSIYKIGTTYDRDRDGFLTEQLYQQTIVDLGDRAKLLAIADNFALLGPQMETDEVCPACAFAWSSKLPIEHTEQFYHALFTTPNEADIIKMVFFLTFGEQAPFKSNAEVMALPIRERDALIQTLSETYEKQQREMKKGGKSSETTSY